MLIGTPTPQRPAIADVLATVSLTEEFLDRWRLPTEVSASSWEERFGYEQYAPLIREAATAALDDAGVAQADHVVLTSPNSAVAKRASTLVKGVHSTGGSPVGFAGAADPLLGLAAVLDLAGPDETILLISAADGVDALVLRTTGALGSRRQPDPVAAAAAADGRVVAYPTYLSWRGLLDMEPPRRPEPDRPPATVGRAASWKFGLNGSRCTACGFVHLPPMRVCRACGAVDQSEPVSVRDSGNRIARSPSTGSRIRRRRRSWTSSSISTAVVEPLSRSPTPFPTRWASVARSRWCSAGCSRPGRNHFWKARQVPAVARASGEEN